MIVIAYLVGIVVFIVTGVRGSGTAPSRRIASITGAVISFGVLSLGLLILVRSGGGPATLIALLALFGSAWYLAGALGTYPGSGAMRVAGAALMVIAFAIPSLLTLLFPVVALLAGWAVRGRAGHRSALISPDSTHR